MVQRRAFILFLAGGGLACLGYRAWAADTPGGARKAIKTEAHYQDGPKDIRSCALCSYFNAPKECTVMEGDVTKNGFCDLYNLVD